MVTPERAESERLNCIWGIKCRQRATERIARYIQEPVEPVQYETLPFDSRLPDLEKSRCSTAQAARTIPTSHHHL